MASPLAMFDADKVSEARIPPSVDGGSPRCKCFRQLQSLFEISRFECSMFLF